MKYKINPDAYIEGNKIIIGHCSSVQTLKFISALKGELINEPESFLKAYTTMAENPHARYRRGKKIDAMYKVEDERLGFLSWSTWRVADSNLSEYESDQWYRIEDSDE